MPAGFTLIEVVMSIGLFSFCIVSIIFLFGVGLDSSRESQRDAAFGAILREMDVELRSKSVSLTASNDLTLFFNAVGSTVANTSPEAAFRAVSHRVAANKAGVTNTNRLSIWKVEISYPAPSYPSTSRPYLIGNALYE
ncbi:MAG: hypothetical protein ABIT76_13640 [Chthoniobacterales bacterium]